MRRRDFTYLLAGLTLLSSWLQARADEWPSHAIRIIVPFGAGGCWGHTRAYRRTASIGELGPAFHRRRSSWGRRYSGNTADRHRSA
jgi:hypothetical protein